MPDSYSGTPGGHLVSDSTDKVAAANVLALHPEIQSQLDKIEKRDLGYVYLETVATVRAEVDLGVTECSIRQVNTYDPKQEGPARRDNLLEMRIGNLPLTISAIPKAHSFRVNVVSQILPRAATVDLAKGTVTYVDEQLWEWKKEWEGHKQKLSQARGAYDVVSWLLDVMKLRLAEPLVSERYDELSSFFGEKRESSSDVR